MISRKGVAFLLVQTVICGSAVFAAEPVSLDELIDAAHNDNLDILAAKKRWEASRARVPQARALDDPTVAVSAGRIPRGTARFDRTPADERMLSVTQTFPLFGRLSLRGRVALVESQMAASEYLAVVWDVSTGVRSAYYELFLKEREVESARQSLQLLRGMGQIAQARYVVGRTSQVEVIKLNLEIARIDTARANALQEAASIRTRLNMLLNRAPEAELGPLQVGEEHRVLPGAEELYEAAVEHRPELALFAHAIERNRHAASLAKRSVFPDITAQMTLRGITTSAVGPWDMMMAFSLPFWFWTKQRFAIREAITNVAEAEAAYESMKNKTRAQIQELVAQINIAQNKVTLLRDNLLPLAHAAIDSARAEYRSGDVDMMPLLDSERMRIDLQLQYYQAMVDYVTYRAKLEQALGIPISEVGHEPA